MAPPLTEEPRPVQRFTETAWTANADLIRRIHALPFNRDLAAGTLAKERFQEYMIQDSLYLVAYGRALAIAAARARTPAEVEFFAESAKVAIVVERALHEGFFKRFGIDPAEAAAAEPSPTCFGYTNFLLATAQTASVETLVAAILPCFWIYWDVGKAIDATAAPDNPYRAWIDTYSDEGFATATKRVIAITDDLADAASPAERARMAQAFRWSCRFEWAFWDAAWRLERWPA